MHLFSKTKCIFKYKCMHFYARVYSIRFKLLKFQVRSQEIGWPGNWTVNPCPICDAMDIAYTTAYYNEFVGAQ